MAPALLTGATLWLICLLTFICVLSGARKTKPRLRLISLLLLAGGALFLFRPHEDILGGQDGGAYLSSASRLARTGAISTPDPLLNQIPREVVNDFLYFPSTHFYPSKYGYGCLKLIDGKIYQHPWFQQAYPAMAGAASYLFGPKALFFTIPFFTLLLTCTLAIFSAQLNRSHVAGFSCFLFFLLLPIVAWHGRGPRPEIIAAFLLWSGLILTLNKTSRFKHAQLIGLLALFTAPFFHITAWFSVIAFCIFMGLRHLSGRHLANPIAFFSLLLISIGLFAFQTFFYTDTYHLARFMPVALCILPFGMAVALFVILRIKPRLKEIPNTAYYCLAGSIPLLFISLAIFSFFHRPEKDALTTQYAAFTDLASIIDIVSLPVALAAIIGLTCLLFQRSVMLQCCSVVLPGSLLIGTMHDFFMMRYTLITLMPLMALGLAALPALLLRSKYRPVKAAGLLLIPLLAAPLLLHRMHLHSSTENKGLYKELEQLAQHINEHNGILLAEYPRYAAPLELFFGIPTLALPNERITDYRPAMAAWHSIKHPDQQAFFLTPFPHLPQHPGFRFLAVDEYAIETHRLKGNRWGLPPCVEPWTEKLYLYEIDTATTDGQHSCTRPFELKLDQGNMGLVNFSTLRNKPRTVPCQLIEPNSSFEVAPSPRPSTDSCQTVLIFRSKTEPNLLTIQNAQNVSTSASIKHLSADWWYALIPTETKAFPLQIKSEAALSLAEATVLAPQFSWYLSETQTLTSSVELTPFDSRWTTTGAAIALPPTSNENDIMLFFFAPPDEVGPELSVTLGSAAPKKVKTTAWRWLATPITQSSEDWLEIASDKPFFPGIDGFPQDLELHVGRIYFIRQ